MQVAVVTLEGFNELDSFIVSTILNRMRGQGWRAYITSPTPEVTSMNGVTVKREKPLSFTGEADAIVFGSGIHTLDAVKDQDLMDQLETDPKRQLIAAQCSGALVLHQLGLLAGTPACTDLTTKPFLLERDVAVLDKPFFAEGNVATAGGCLSSPYLAAWLIARMAPLESAREALHYVAPVGEKSEFVDHAMREVSPYLVDGLGRAA